MRRRDKAGGKAVKAQRLKRGNASKSTRPLGKDTNVAQLKRERDEALEQQRATSEVLKVISSSRGEPKPVFKKILESALRICEAEFGMLMLHHSGDGSFDTRVMVGAPPALVDALLHQSFTPPPGNPLHRMLRTKKTVHVIDAGGGKGQTALCTAGWRALTYQRADGKAERSRWRHLRLPHGGSTIHRQTDRAGYKFRRAGRHRHRERRPVQRDEGGAGASDRGLRSASDDRQLDGGRTTGVRTHPRHHAQPGRQRRDWNPARIRRRTSAHGGSLRHGPGSFQERVPDADRVDRGKRRDGRTAPAGSSRTDPNDQDAPPSLARAAEVMGNYSRVITPMIWERRSIGVISVAREPNAAFTDKELGLLRTFADQAVIAIQNTRLFNETREALEGQTATADILKVIASSPSDVQPVFEAIAERANRLVEGLSTGVYRLVDEHRT